MLLLGVCSSIACSAVVDIGLDGSWEFAFVEDTPLERAYDEDAQAGGFAVTATMPVPGCFDAMPDFLRKRGTGLYRRTFRLERDTPDALVRVEGMGLRCAVSIDGRPLSADLSATNFVSALPYSTVTFGLNQSLPLSAGPHLITAAVDNMFDAVRQPLFLPYYDFYAFGGFYHGVSLRCLETSSDIERIYVRTVDFRKGRVSLELDFLNAWGVAADPNVTLPVSVDGRPIGDVSFKDGRAEITVPRPTLWSPEHPMMHTVTVKGCTERFGIRQIEARGKRLFLNGEPLYLKGVNRHESHPEFGAATPEVVMARDLQLVRRLGGNFVRGAHYPQCRRFLDLCDEMGVLVWEEALGWGNTPAQMQDGRFIAANVEQTELMVRNSFNHPSVIIFGFLNENDSSSPAGKALVERLVDVVRGFDSGRLVTYACNRTGNDIANEKTDIIAFNAYPGWIGSDAGSPANLKRLVREEVDRTVKYFRSRYGDKPIIVSEMGTCGVYGQRDVAAAQWTEEFQAEYLADETEVVFANEEICGFTVWQFCDAPSYLRGGASVRVKPFAVNLAGLFDGYRRPKLAAGAIERAFKSSETQR